MKKQIRKVHVDGLKWIWIGYRSLYTTCIRIYSPSKQIYKITKNELTEDREITPGIVKNYIESKILKKAQF